MYFYVIKKPKPPQNVYLLFTMLILVQSMLCNEILVFLKIFSLLVIGVLAFGLKISKNLQLCGRVLIQKIWQMVAGVPQGKYFKSCLSKGMVKICLFTFLIITDLAFVIFVDNFFFIFVKSMTILVLYYELFWSITASWPRIAVTIISLCVPWYHDIRETYFKVKISHTKALNMDIMFKIFWYVILSHE